MKAIRVHQFGGIDALVCEDVDQPTPGFCYQYSLQTGSLTGRFAAPFKGKAANRPPPHLVVLDAPRCGAFGFTRLPKKSSSKFTGLPDEDSLCRSRVVT